MPTIDLTPMPHEEAARLIDTLPPVTREVFNELVPELQMRVFVISGMNQADTLQAARDAIAEVPRGADWDETRDQLAKILDPYADEEGQARARKKADFLIRHHAFVAYSAANHRNLERMRDVFPYRRYVTAQDERVRSSHAALHGLTLPADSPFWLNHTPPWEFGCRCDVIGVTQQEYDDQKQEEDLGNLPDGMREILNSEQQHQLETTGRLERLRVAGSDGEGFRELRPVVWDVRTDREQRGGTGGFEWRPGDLTLKMEDLRQRYDAETWAKMQQLLENQKPEWSNISAWDWLNGQRLDPQLIGEELDRIENILDDKRFVLTEDQRQHDERTAQNAEEAGGLFENLGRILSEPNRELAVSPEADPETIGRDRANSVSGQGLGWDVVELWAKQGREDAEQYLSELSDDQKRLALAELRSRSGKRQLAGDIEALSGQKLEQAVRQEAAQLGDKIFNQPTPAATVPAAFQRGEYRSGFGREALEFVNRDEPEEAEPGLLENLGRFLRQGFQQNTQEEVQRGPKTEIDPEKVGRLKDLSLTTEGIGWDVFELWGKLGKEEAVGYLSDLSTEQKTEALNELLSRYGRGGGAAVADLDQAILIQVARMADQTQNDSARSVTVPKTFRTANYRPEFGAEALGFVESAGFEGARSQQMRRQFKG